MINFNSFQGVTHPVFILQPSGMNVGVNIHHPDKQEARLTGKIDFSGHVLGGALPPGWTPTAASLACVGSREPWVLMPMAALERHFTQKHAGDGLPPALPSNPNVKAMPGRVTMSTDPTKPLERVDGVIQE